MPLLINCDERAGTLARAINDLLVTGGPAALSMRRVAAVSGVSTSSMLHHLGSREHMIRVAAGLTSEARQYDLRLRSLREGALAFLPETSDQVPDARGWLAWQELWRSEPSLELGITRARAEERDLLARVLDHRLARDDLDTVTALIDGLTVAVCSPASPMRIDRARQLLARHLKALGIDAAGRSDVA